MHAIWYVILNSIFCTIQEIANTLWSYATLGHHPGGSLLDAIAAQMVERIQHFRPQVLVSACSRLSLALVWDLMAAAAGSVIVVFPVAEPSQCKLPLVIPHRLSGTH